MKKFFFFQKAEYLVKTIKKCFLKKLSVWLILIKVEVWVINYQKGQDIYIYIYKREFFILIISLHTSYGHNIFAKISHWSLYDKLLMVDKKIIMSLVGANEN